MLRHCELDSSCFVETVVTHSLSHQYPACGLGHCLCFYIHIFLIFRLHVADCTVQCQPRHDTALIVSSWLHKFTMAAWHQVAQPAEGLQLGGWSGRSPCTPRNLNKAIHCKLGLRWMFEVRFAVRVRVGYGLSSCNVCDCHTIRCELPSSLCNSLTLRIERLFTTFLYYLHMRQDSRPQYTALVYLLPQLAHCRHL